MDKLGKTSLQFDKLNILMKLEDCLDLEPCSWSSIFDFGSRRLSQTVMFVRRVLIIVVQFID